MKKILLILSIIISFYLSLSCLIINYDLFWVKVSFYDYNSKNIFPNSPKLDTNIIIFKSDTNITKYKIKSDCKNSFNYVWKQRNLYFFKIKILEDKCEKPNFVLTNWKKDFDNTFFSLDIKSDYYIFGSIIDYSNTKLKNFDINIDNKIKEYSKYSNVKTKTFYEVKRQRIYNELKYNKAILSNIIDKRKNNYAIPVKWYEISEELNEIPNAGRPYRNHYTDWIHHWWDIMAPIGTPFFAIDDWIIIRVIKDFVFEDLSKIKKEWEITKTQKMENLDMLRWNQVWLKTSKWDVIFYSHLSKVYDWIEVWKLIKVWDYIWEIWKSWVPDKNYTNIHLHFPIQKNPYSLEKAWKYTFEDYMFWDWYLKWLPLKEVIEKQKDIFE